MTQENKSKKRVSDATKLTQVTSLPDEKYGSTLLWGDERQEMEADTPSPKHHSAEPSKSTLHKIIIHRNYFAKIEKDPISMFQGLGKKRCHLKRTTNFLFPVSELDSNFAEFAKRI